MHWTKADKDKVVSWYSHGMLIYLLAAHTPAGKKKSVMTYPHRFRVAGICRKRKAIRF